MDVMIPESILNDPYAGKELLVYLKRNFGLSKDIYDKLKFLEIHEIKKELLENYNFIN